MRAWNLLALVCMGVIITPILFCVPIIVIPILDTQIWFTTFSDNQFIQASLATLCSSIVGTLLALFLCLVSISVSYNNDKQSNYQSHVAIFLSLPHLTLAISCLLLFSPSGLFSRLFELVPFIGNIFKIEFYDFYGVKLGFLLAFKESFFLIWIAYSQLNKVAVTQKIIIAKTLGYSQWQAYWLYIFPDLLPRLWFALLVVIAYNVAVVDVAMILGPSNPPTLAVLAWQWLADASITLQLQGHVITMVLMLILIFEVLLFIGLWYLYNYLFLSDIRTSGRCNSTIINQIIEYSLKIIVYIMYLGVLLLVIWSFTRSWFYPNLLPQKYSLMNWANINYTNIFNTISLAVIASCLGLLIVLLFLENFNSKKLAIILLPLLLPALPLVVSQYGMALFFNFNGSFASVVWSHLLWVIPYMLLTLKYSYHKLDPKLLIIARTLSLPTWKINLLIKWPILIKPILYSVAVGFSVSVAQYLSTMYIGSGRVQTITTEIIALSSGSDTRMLALYSLLEVMTSASLFLLVIFIMVFIGRYRRGLV